MGKVVKYCGKCEEGFAERFGFCPNCGLELQAFEMNPLKAESPVPAESIKAETIETRAPEPQVTETLPKVEEPVLPATMAFSDDGISDDEILDLEFEDADDAIVEEKEPVKPFVPAAVPAAPAAVPVVPAVTAASAAAATAGANGNGNGNGYKFQQETVSDNGAAYNFSRNTSNQNTEEEDGYHVTVIKEKNVQQRNSLLLGFSALALVIVSGLMLWSLFTSDLFVGPLDQPELFAFVPEIDPAQIEEEVVPKKNKDDGGGGGGGGKENPDPVTKGRLPTQVEKPVNPPMIVPQLTKPEFVVKNETQGKITREPTNEVVGLPTGLTSDKYSSGSGNGGGIGNGNGTGVGNGRGTGEGNGIGSGSGNGNGNGNGNGKGDGDDDAPTVKEKPVGISKGVNITSKPRANYTDTARQNQVQGTVTLRVTFNANGSIGSVAAVSGLPYGLTEQAIAAAKQIRFEPAMKNGQAVPVTKQVQYSFTIY